MKALKSKLASQILADPFTRDQFRHFLANKSAATALGGHGASGVFLIHGRDGELIEVKVVPKANTTA